MGRIKLGLIIDDNEMDTFVVKAVLEKFNFAESVISVPGAHKALELVQGLKKQIEDGHLSVEEVCIFLDYEMPYMNGGGFISALEAMAPDFLQRTYMLSILSVEEQIACLKMKPAIKGFLSKPLGEATLLQILSQQEIQKAV
ncbi:response regulator [Nafulsella turpanensis]|uniref:response regulator n=1 Tax=Nafulsella turpanensis TaxID=1265690 RepID=UPI00034B3C79|nr:response regulator [Nafulsella turpanensis]